MNDIAKLAKSYLCPIVSFCIGLWLGKQVSPFSFTEQKGNLAKSLTKFLATTAIKQIIKKI